MKMKLYMGVATLCIFLMICGVYFFKRDSPSSASENVSSSDVAVSAMMHKKPPVSAPSVSDQLHSAELEYLSSLSPADRERSKKLRNTASFQKGLANIEKILETSSSTAESSSLAPEIDFSDTGELIYTHYQERFTATGTAPKALILDKNTNTLHSIATGEKLNQATITLQRNNKNQTLRIRNSFLR